MTDNKNLQSKDNDRDDGDEFDDQPPKIPYRRDRTPSIVVQSLGLSFHKDSNITESIELTNDDVDSDSHSSETSDPRSSTSGIDEAQNLGACDSSGNSAKGSSTSLHNSTPPGPISPVFGQTQAKILSKPSPNRRLSLNIGSTAPRRPSLTVDGLTSFVNAGKETYSGGSATGSLRNKVALKPGHSLMGWIKLASTAKDLSGTNGKIIEVSPEELAKHDKEDDCWVALKGNVYNVTIYLQYHPGGVDELMRAAGRDATDLFNEVHRWVNYESILAKCLVGPYKIESPLTPVGRGSFTTMTTTSPTSSSTATKTSQNRRDPTVAQKPPRRQSIALTVPSPNKYQSLLLNNNSNSNLNQVQQPPTYVIMQDKSCIKLKVQDLTTLPLIRSRHIICDLNEKMELHSSVILSSDWLYRVHLQLDQPIERRLSVEASSDEGSITIRLNKKESAIWNKIGTSLDLNDSLCEMTLADKFFRPCQLLSKKQLTHDTHLFEFKLENTIMYVPIGWHVLIREKTNNPDKSNASGYDDPRVHKNYTPVLPELFNNDGLLDESGFMKQLFFIIKIYPEGTLTSKLSQLKIGDSVEISDYQFVDFDVENNIHDSKHWILFAAGTGITPFCRTISYLLSQSDEDVKSVTLAFFNKTQEDIILRDQFDKLEKDFPERFKVIHILSNESVNGGPNPSATTTRSNWTGKRGKISKDLAAELIDSFSPDELQLLACGPRAFTQLTKSIMSELNLNEKLYIFHG